MAKAKGFGALARNMEGMQARYPEGARVVAGTTLSESIVHRLLVCTLLSGESKRVQPCCLP